MSSLLLDLAPSEQRVLDLIRYRGPMSRADLAREAALAPPTLSRLVQQLLERGLVLEGDKVHDGQRGKPAQLLRLNASGAYVAGFALQSEYLEGCIADMEGAVRASAVIPLDTLACAPVMRLVAGMLEDLFVRAGVRREDLIGAGVSMPGMALGAYGSGARPVGANDLPDEFEDWKSLDLRALFESVLGLPCWLENSSKAVTLAEMYYGEGRRLANFAVLHVAYGFGGGLIINRRPYRGPRGRAGEFGGLFPYAGIRPSGRDLLLYLADRMGNPPQHLRDIDLDAIPDHLIDGWVERVYPCLHDLSKFLAVALDLEAIVLHGLVPPKIMGRMADLIRQRLPASLPHEFAMPDVVISRLPVSGLSVGAASLPLHFTTAETP